MLGRAKAWAGLCFIRAGGGLAAEGEGLLILLRAAGKAGFVEEKKFNLRQKSMTSGANLRR